MTDVQPTEGQGQESTTGGLFDTYLQAVPEDAREYVTGYLKDAEKNVNSRLEEAAQIQKQFGPLKNIEGLTEYDPKDLAQLVSWHREVGQSEETFTAWLKQAAQQAGLTLAEAEDALDQGELSPQQIQQAAEQRALEKITPLEERLSQFEAAQQEAAQTAAMEQHIESEFAQIEKETGPLSEDVKKAIADLGESHKGDDWIQVGFARFKALTGDAQTKFVKEKAAAPAPPVASGGQEATHKPLDWAEVQKQAKESLMASMRS